MIPWAPARVSPRTWAIAAAIPLAMVLAAWFAGAIFLTVSGAGPLGAASPLTLYSYWYWYGSDPKIEAWLYVSSACGVLGLVLPAAPFLVPRRESLHGDAKWSKTRHLRRAA